MTKSAKQSPLREMTPFINLGMELCASMAGAGILGWFIDKTFGTQPTWLVVLLILGIIGGMTRFIRTALRLSSNKTSRGETTTKRQGVPSKSDEGSSSGTL